MGSGQAKPQEEPGYLGSSGNPSWLETLGRPGDGLGEPLSPSSCDALCEGLWFFWSEHRRSPPSCLGMAAAV